MQIKSGYTGFKEWWQEKECSAGWVQTQSPLWWWSALSTHVKGRLLPDTNALTSQGREEEHALFQVSRQV